MTPWIVDHLWLVPVAPLAASAVILFLFKQQRHPERSFFCESEKNAVEESQTAPGRRRAAQSRGITIDEAASLMIPRGPSTPLRFAQDDGKNFAAAGLAILGQIIALALAVFAFLPTLQSPGWRQFHNFEWFTFGETALRIGWLLDPLTAAMLVMIALVGLCIFIFSAGYMAEDKHFARFFAYLSFFSAAMLGVVIANSLLLLFVCWELVGFASYLLIGFWIHKPSAAAAAKKAFITTRIGDIGFFLGMLWLYRDSGTLLFYDGGNGCLESPALLALGASSTFVALLIFCGAAGKSGQFPLHVWLPDAMEGPTPVSALIHAATMVAAGVFLVARVYPIFSAGAVNGVTPSLTVVVWIGVITALISALIALAQADIKRILAYSTVSQLGLMMVSLGVGGVAAGIMHLLAHGFFKALLFLGSGSVIHGCHHEQDIRKMGGLRTAMPLTFATYAIGMMALSGVPLFFSGAWTKEEILHAAHRWPVSPAPYYLMLAGVFLTALYMTRQMAYIFFGNRRSASEHAHESPPVITLPLVVLAICAVFFSAVLTPAWPWLHSYLDQPSPSHSERSGAQPVRLAPLAQGKLHAVEESRGPKTSLEASSPDLSRASSSPLRFAQNDSQSSIEHLHFAIGKIFQPLLFLSLAIISAGVFCGALIYRNAGESDPLQRTQPALFRFLENKMWLDELYEWTVLAWSAAAARLSDWLDRYVWDGFVRLIASIGQCVAHNTANFDEGGINTAVDQGCERTQGLGRAMSFWHGGQVQNYLRFVGLGMLALLLLYVWLA